MRFSLGFRLLHLGLLVLVASPRITDAEILFDGEWENYLGRFYGADGWQNGVSVGQPTGDGDWTDYQIFKKPKPLDNTWLNNDSWARDRIRLEKDPTSPKHGLVARFEVRSGDHRPANFSGERSEMYDMLGRGGQRLPVTEESGHEYYGISVKVSPDWQGPLPDPYHKGRAVWGTLMQLHSPNAFSSPPALDLMAEEDFHISMDTGNLDRVVIDPQTGQQGHAMKPTQSIPLLNGDLRRGHWVQFVLDIVWASDAKGALAVYRRDEGQTNFAQVLNLVQIPTLQSANDRPTDLAQCPMCSPINLSHYWRIGYYRSVSQGVTSVLWLGPVVRGTSFDEVAIAAFGSSGPRRHSSH